MTIGSIYDEGQRNPCSIGQQTAFGSPFAMISGISSGRGADKRGFRHYPIHSLPLPLDPLHVIEFMQTRFQGFEEAPFSPLLDAIMNGGTHSQFAWEGIPLDTSP